MLFIKPFWKQISSDNFSKQKICLSEISKAILRVYSQLGFSKMKKIAVPSEKQLLFSVFPF